MDWGIDSSESVTPVESPPTFSIDQFGRINLDEETPKEDSMASYGGAGTWEISDVIRILQKAGITCCLMGTSALIYYGAAGVRNVSYQTL